MSNISCRKNTNFSSGKNVDDFQESVDEMYRSETDARPLDVQKKALKELEIRRFLPPIQLPQRRWANSMVGKSERVAQRDWDSLSLDEKKGYIEKNFYTSNGPTHHRYTWRCCGTHSRGHLHKSSKPCPLMYNKNPIEPEAVEFPDDPDVINLQNHLIHLKDKYPSKDLPRICKSMVNSFTFQQEPKERKVSKYRKEFLDKNPAPATPRKWKELTSEEKQEFIKTFYRFYEKSGKHRWNCCDSGSRTHIGAISLSCNYIQNDFPIETIQLTEFKSELQQLHELIQKVASKYGSKEQIITVMLERIFQE